MSSQRFLHLTASRGAGARAEWWRKLRGGSLDPNETFDDADLWARVEAAQENVVLWHGPHARERIFALRACWHLCERSDRIREVALKASGAVWPNRPRPAFYDAVALAGPTVAAAAWPPQTILDVDHRAGLWQELRDREGEWIRELDEGEAVVHLPVTTYDLALIEACRSQDWTRTRYVVASVLSDHGTSDDLLWWRIREMLREGVLAGRGVDREFKVPDEVRPATFTAAPSG